MSFGIDEWFVVTLARTIRDHEVVFHGFGSPCAQVARHVARQCCARNMLLVEGATYAEGETHTRGEVVATVPAADFLPYAFAKTDDLSSWLGVAQEPALAAV